VFVELVGAEGIVPDPGEVLEAGQETTVEVIEVDIVRERVILSLAPTPIGGHQRP
jgi:ribosomal protein S1